MMPLSSWKAGHLRKRATQMYRQLGSGAQRHRDILERFCRQHSLLYLSPTSAHLIGQLSTDDPERHYHDGAGIGSHAGYEVMIHSYRTTAFFPGFASVPREWLEVQIELPCQLPFLFIGNRQQPNAYYAQLLSTHRSAQYLHIACPPALDKPFHERYAVLAAASDVAYVKALFDEQNIAAFTHRHETIAYHIEGNVLTVLTQRQKPRIQTLDRLFHAGIWLADELQKVDQRATDKHNTARS